MLRSSVVTVHGLSVRNAAGHVTKLCTGVRGRKEDKSYWVLTIPPVLLSLPRRILGMQGPYCTSSPSTAELEPHPLDRWGYLVTVPQATTDSAVELELVELLFQVTVQIFEVFTFIPKQRIHFSY